MLEKMKFVDEKAVLLDTPRAPPQGHPNQGGELARLFLRESPVNFLLLQSAVFKGLLN